MLNNKHPFSFFCRNKSIKLQKGAQWFSISDELARYVVSLESWIQKTFKNTSCCDELFLQTIVVNSPFRKRLYYNKFDDNYCAIVRLIGNGATLIFLEKPIFMN